MAGFDAEHHGNGTGVICEMPMRSKAVDRGCGVVLGVAEALADVFDAIGCAAPALVWVEGEVDGLTHSRAGHWYWSLSGGGGRLAVCALGRDAAVIARTLAVAEVVLADGLTVRVRGSLGVYRPRGQLQLRASAIDPAVCVGAAVFARREVRGRLVAAGLAGRQAALRPVGCPLRVAVVAPPGRGLEDFVSVLAASPWAWQVEVASVPSEGAAAPAAIAAAISRVGGAELIVVTRGGGARVTTAYDAFEVAAAVCASAVPVVMAVGHSADASVADEMAWRSVATPTAAGDLCVWSCSSTPTGVWWTPPAGSPRPGRACLEHSETELDALSAAIAARAAPAAREFALARWRRTACTAVLAAAVLAAMVLCLLLLR